MGRDQTQALFGTVPDPGAQPRVSPPVVVVAHSISLGCLGPVTRTACARSVEARVSAHPYTGQYSAVLSCAATPELQGAGLVLSNVWREGAGGDLPAKAVGADLKMALLGSSSDV